MDFLVCQTFHLSGYHMINELKIKKIIQALKNVTISIVKVSVIGDQVIFILLGCGIYRKFFLFQEHVALKENENRKNGFYFIKILLLLFF